ncbi:non-canonical purine NTP pyrophosphatase [Candidatus Woesearchaeota archaeon]|nr:non-canonical purine NTP pyrophosphatase [Candidatus Woesearchaeota archaeon]
MILVTRNEKKIEEFSKFLGAEIKFKVLKAEYPELRFDSSCEVAMSSAKALAEKLKDEVVVEDSGLFIKALGGFPGTCTRYVHERIGNAGILKLMKGVRNRQCEYVSAIGFCAPGKKPMCFRGVEEGRIAEKEKGKNGWGQDPIFIPKGSKKTYGETRRRGDINLFRARAIGKLKAFLAQSGK